MSDNRTNEPTEARNVEEMTMSDNRTNEPTEAQVEAAAKIIRRASLETTADPGDFWSDCYEGEQEAWRNAARAALEAAARAAQGAAPQAAKDIHEPSHDRVYCVRCGGNWPCQPPPVLPSSGVDEIWRGRIVTASFENGTGDLDCGLEECECPEHEQPPRPAGTYVTVRLDKDERVGLTDVEIRVLAGKEENE